MNNNSAENKDIFVFEKGREVIKQINSIIKSVLNLSSLCGYKLTTTQSIFFGLCIIYKMIICFLNKLLKLLFFGFGLRLDEEWEKNDINIYIYRFVSVDLA